jgi:hypothetical protein
MVRAQQDGSDAEGAAWAELCCSPALLQLSVSVLGQLHMLAHKPPKPYIPSSSASSGSAGGSSDSAAGSSVGQEATLQQPSMGSPGQQQRVADWLCMAAGFPRQTCLHWRDFNQTHEEQGVQALLPRTLRAVGASAAQG